MTQQRGTSFDSRIVIPALFLTHFSLFDFNLDADQLVGQVIFVYIADVLNRFTSNPLGSDDLKISEPYIKLSFTPSACSGVVN
jgi:hypothetical protein